MDSVLTLLAEYSWVFSVIGTVVIVIVAFFDMKNRLRDYLETRRNRKMAEKVSNELEPVEITGTWAPASTSAESFEEIDLESNSVELIAIGVGRKDPEREEIPTPYGYHLDILFPDDFNILTKGNPLIGRDKLGRTEQVIDDVLLEGYKEPSYKGLPRFGPRGTTPKPPSVRHRGSHAVASVNRVGKKAHFFQYLFIHTPEVEREKEYNLKLKVNSWAWIDGEKVKMQKTERDLKLMIRP